MGKDKEGKFHPAGGKPSGINKEEGPGLRKSMDPPDLENDEQITARYTPVNEDELSPDIRVRHPNRNTSGAQDSSTSEAVNYKGRQQTQTEEFVKTVAEELPGIIHKDLFNYLSSYTDEKCASILLTTHPSGVEVNEQQDVIAFKNALQQVEKILHQKNTDAAIINRMLQPGYDMLRDDELWKNLGRGLAVYMSDGFFKFMRLAGTIKNEVLVSGTFSVSALVPFMVRKEYFYLLVISKKKPQFYRADPFGIEHIPIDEMPDGVDDVVHFENKDGKKLFRAGSGDRGGANFHGIGSGKPDDKQNVAAFLEEVDDTIWKTHLHYSTAPLLLAGLDHYIPIYRSVSDYSNIWPEALTGNHSTEDTNYLHGRAMEVMRPYFDQKLEKGLDEYGNKSATDLTSVNSYKIIPAAFYGKVSRLFVQKDVQIWGTFDEQSNELKVFSSMKEGAENLADRAAAKTIQNGGDVFILEKDKMPGAGELAAIFRY